MKNLVSIITEFKNKKAKFDDAKYSSQYSGQLKTDPAGN